MITQTQTTEQIKNLLAEMNADNELFAIWAQHLMKASLALIEAGFTAEQATQIVAQQRILDISAQLV